jgi:hypothetical protein
MLAPKVRNERSGHGENGATMPPSKPPCLPKMNRLPSEAALKSDGAASIGCLEHLIHASHGAPALDALSLHAMIHSTFGASNV